MNEDIQCATLETIGEAIGKLGSHLECQEKEKKAREREREYVDFLRVRESARKIFVY